MPFMCPEARMDFSAPMAETADMTVVSRTFHSWGASLRVCFVLAMAGGTIFADSDKSLLGRRAPDWDGAIWLNSAPVQLPQLAGKVVLIRWWTAPGCPYCRATAPALNEFHAAYRDRGLEVIGFYHHKSTAPLDQKDVMEHARRFGFNFPIAVDPDWQTLKRWWLHNDERWTSVSFLLDRRGVVRHIHPGGQYVKGDAEYQLLRSKIEELLAEK
jgi:thiol-disulfide isomerase/thioredoxin